MLGVEKKWLMLLLEIDMSVISECYGFWTDTCSWRKFICIYIVKSNCLKNWLVGKSMFCLLVWLKKIVLRWFSFSLLSSVSLVAAEPICIRSLNALTLCWLDGPLIKYPQFPDVFNVWKVHNRPTSWYVVFSFSCSMPVMSRSPVLTLVIDIIIRIQICRTDY